MSLKRSCKNANGIAPAPYSTLPIFQSLCDPPDTATGHCGVSIDNIVNVCSSFEYCIVHVHVEDPRGYQRTLIQNPLQTDTTINYESTERGAAGVWISVIPGAGERKSGETAQAGAGWRWPGELSGHRASSQFSVRHQTANRWAAATFLVLVLFGSFLRLKMFNLWPSWEDFYTAPHLYDGF